MKIYEVQKILAADFVIGYDYEARELKTCFACDLISDLLTFTGENPLLLTGLTNIQVIRTADILDLLAICFVRGKLPQPETIDMAKEKKIPLLVTKDFMFESCGKLYQAGLQPAVHKGE